ncbi:alginate lyase family protein [Streptomyces sp. NPDC051940]|uniref:alginate lyase family protein n=1 Tax=Streptomyces sp. NPDC051940 TaxID=3155675 RepID=UPI003416F653
MWGRALAAAVCAAALILPGAAASGAEPVDPGVPKAPRTVVIDGARLQQAKVRLALGDPGLRAARDALVAQAGPWLAEGPWTVVDKPRPAPSGDPHDYLSQAPYWWPSQTPTTDNPWGCPYVQRDGVRNPEVDTGTDRPELGKLVKAVQTLTLAWYYTGEEAYARHAALLLRTWFTDPDTAMNPNLDHAQFIPCRYTGRAIGIIDFSQMYTSVLDAVAILQTGAPGWTAEDAAAMRQWNSDFLDWLLTSDFGKEEAAAKNNHGTFHDMQVAALALAVDRPALARQVVLDAAAKRIDPQIAADGAQPGELSRTRSWHYSSFNLMAFARLADIGRHVGVDLWRYEGPQGQSLFDAVDYLLPAATGAAPWTHPELDFHAYAATDVIHAAADAGDPAARAAVPLLQAPPGGDLWALRPAAEQLYSTAG